MKKIVVCVSGGGTDLQSIIDGVGNGSIKAGISLVISSRHGVFAEKRAEKHGIPYIVVSKTDYPDKKELYSEMLRILDEIEPDLIVLAGYVCILPPEIIDKYRGKIINIHPSLIPKHCGKGYYGLKVHESVLASGDTESGVTVHFVDEGADTGKIIRQEKVAVLPGDTPESLQQRVLCVEHKVLPEVVASLVNGSGDSDKRQ